VLTIQRLFLEAAKPYGVPTALSQCSPSLHVKIAETIRSLFTLHTVDISD